MSAVVTCPCGHSWQPARAAPPGAARACPACGSPVAAPETLAPSPSAGAEAPTLPPKAAGMEAAPSSPWGPAGAAPADDGPAVPGYEILGELGRGGMGVVYRARHTRLGRVVALKMILSGAHAGADDLARFRTEAEAIARLQHPNIVQIYEVGEQRGLPYFSLEFCGGGSLEKKLRDTPLPPPAAAALVERLARAMQAAHERGVIHRDLKPANVLLAEDGTPKITDFGLAKKLDEAGRTLSGAVMGTPSYMAPEQAGGQSQQIGPRADVYALGAILYECLTGRPPFKAATELDTILQVVGAEPVAPSALNPRVPRDLETVALKAMAKRPEDRYPSAAELADDLRRFLAAEPVRARRTGPVGRLVRWCRRHPAPAALVLVSAVALVALVGVAVGAAYNARVAQARDEAERQKQLAQTYLYFNRIALAEREWWNGNVGRAQQLLEECPAELRGWEWHHLRRQCHLDEHTLRGHSNQVLTLAYSPDGKRLASASLDGTVRIWEAATGREVHVLASPTNSLVGVAWSPDGQWLGTIAPQARVQVWSSKDWEPAYPPLGPHTGTIWRLAFSPDSKILAVGSGEPGRRGAIKLWNVATGRALAVLEGHTRPACSLAFRRDGRQLASAGADLFMAPSGEGEIILWDVPSRKPLHTFSAPGSHLAVAFSPDGKRLASAGDDGQVTLRDAVTGKVVDRLAGHGGAVSGLAFSPDGRRLASSGDDQTIRVWNAAGASELTVLRGHTNWVNDCVFSPDGRHLASASDDGTVKIWDLQAVLQFQPPPNDVLTSRLLDDQASCVALFTSADQVRFWDARTGRTRATLAFTVPRVACNNSFVSPDGQRLVVPAPAAQEDDSVGTLELWDVGNKRKLHALPCPRGDTYQVAFSADGGALAVVVGDRGARGEVRVWDVGTARELLALREEGRRFVSATFSPDGRQLATVDFAVGQPVDNDAVLTVREVATGRPSVSVRGPFWWATYSPDGKRLAVTRGDNGVSLIDARDGAELQVLRGHRHRVGAMAFSPDGKRLATGGRDRVVKVWDPATGQEALTLRGMSDWVTSLRFSADGKRLLAADRRGQVQMWDGTPQPDLSAP